MVGKISVVGRRNINSWSA